MSIQVDADSMETISTVVDISGGELYESYEEVILVPHSTVLIEGRY